MINVNPNIRPTAEQILNQESVKNLTIPKKKNNEQNESSVQNNSLLQTIKCNIKNFKDIG
jgi:superfamily I DNA and RNA helicase